VTTTRREIQLSCRNMSQTLQEPEDRVLTSLQADACKASDVFMFESGDCGRERAAFYWRRLL